MSKFYDYKLKFRTIDELMASVADDFSVQDAENFIDPSQLIKVVRKINKQLGLRITKTNEKVINFSNWVVNLPDNMESLNFALLCGTAVSVVPAIQGTIAESDNECCLTDCQDCFKIVYRTLPNLETRFRIEERVNIKNSLYHMSNCEVEGVILSDNFLRLNVESGKLYLNYEGVLEDKCNKLLVLDHPLVNDYYEYAIKERVLENMYFAGEDTERKLALVGQRVGKAKEEAGRVVNMPEFEELQEINELNRIAMYKKYYSIFV